MAAATRAVSEDEHLAIVQDSVWPLYMTIVNKFGTPCLGRPPLSYMGVSPRQHLTSAQDSI